MGLQEGPQLSLLVHLQLQLLLALLQQSLQVREFALQVIELLLEPMSQLIDVAVVNVCEILLQLLERGAMHSLLFQQLGLEQGHFVAQLAGLFLVGSYE